MELTDFLRARWDEEEAAAREIIAKVAASPGSYVSLGLDHPELATGDSPSYLGEYDPARVLRDVEAKRRIVDLHESWPVLVESKPEFPRADVSAEGMAVQMSQRVAWMTTQEYRARFGDEPPTSPVLRLLALPYDQHEDYDESWRP